MGILDRRSFLKYSAEVTGRTVAGFTALYSVGSCQDPLSPSRPRHRLVAGTGEGGYGPLTQVGPELAVPKGFSYRVLGVEGSTMSDGNITPAKHDGMCALPLPNGNIRLIRNHEIENNPQPNAAVGNIETAYDPGAGGGTVSLEVRPDTRELIRDFVSLNGTWRNCAGGPTPWGSWLSCEEAYFGPEEGFGEPHGYVFEVPAELEEPRRAEPIKPLGRFVHEAVAVDPATGIIYETEDLFRAGFYRFLPNEPYLPGAPGNLHSGGRLQMLAVRRQRRYDTSTGQTVGRTLEVHWVDIDEPNPPGGQHNAAAVFKQGWKAGGVRFSRLEGCWYGDGNVYFISTDGGNASLGQVWQYRPTDLDTGVLTLVFESPDRNLLNRPDNITVSPRGGVVLCEDGRASAQYLRGLTPDGRIFDIARNLANDAELAGATFSPDGKTLFFNAFGNARKGAPGMTFAVWGPWETGAI